MTNNVKKIENIIPVTKTIPIVNLDSYPAPDPKINGIIPITVDKPVITMGLNLTLHASIIELYEFFKKEKLSGVDRIVPIGTALDIGPIWDGYDIIKILSREIEIK